MSNPQLRRADADAIGMQGAFADQLCSHGTGQSGHHAFAVENSAAQPIADVAVWILLAVHAFAGTAGRGGYGTYMAVSILAVQRQFGVTDEECHAAATGSVQDLRDQYNPLRANSGGRQAALTLVGDGEVPFS